MGSVTRVCPAGSTPQQATRATETLAKSAKMGQSRHVVVFDGACRWVWRSMGRCVVCVMHAPSGAVGAVGQAKCVSYKTDHAAKGQVDRYKSSQIKCGLLAIVPFSFCNTPRVQASNIITPTS